MVVPLYYIYIILEQNWIFEVSSVKFQFTSSALTMHSRDTPDCASFKMFKCWRKCLILRLLFNEDKNCQVLKCIVQRCTSYSYSIWTNRVSYSRYIYAYYMYYMYYNVCQILEWNLNTILHVQWVFIRLV